MEEEHKNKLFHALNLYESFISSSATNKEVIVNYLSDNSSYETRFFNDLTKVSISNTVAKLEINNNSNNSTKIFNASNTLLELLNITRIYNLLTEYLSLTEMVGFYILVNNNNNYDNNIIEYTNSNGNNTKESVIHQWVQNVSNRRDLENEILYLKLKILRTNFFCTDINNSIDYILFTRYSQQLNSINESLALQSFQSCIANENVINSYMECVAILHQKFLDSILLLNQSVKNSTKEVCEIKQCMIDNILTNLQENIRLENTNNNDNILETAVINKVYNDSIQFIKLKIEKFQSEVINIFSNNDNINIETNNIMEKMNDLNNVSHDILLKQYDDQISIEHEQFTKQLLDSYDNCMNIIVKHMENNLISEELHY